MGSSSGKGGVPGRMLHYIAEIPTSLKAANEALEEPGAAAPSSKTRQNQGGAGRRGAAELTAQECETPDMRGSTPCQHFSHSKHTQGGRSRRGELGDFSVEPNWSHLGLKLKRLGLSIVDKKHSFL